MPLIPDQEQIEYMLAHAGDNLAPQIIISSSICGPLVLLFLCLRLFSRRLVGVWVLSDWLIIIAFIFFAAWNIFLSYSTRYGAGKHIVFVEDPRMLSILFLCAEVFYLGAIGFIKFSVIALYASIFPQRSFHYVLWGLTALVSGWLIAWFFVTIFQCVPIEYNWDPTIPGGHCTNTGIQSLIIGTINIITDFILLLLPAPLVWKLNLSTRKKWLLLFTFMTGSSACIVSILRQNSTLNVGTTADPSYDDIPAAVLSTIETSVGIFAVSLPSYRPLYQRVMQRLFPASSTTKNSYGKSGYSNQSSHVAGWTGHRTDTRIMASRAANNKSSGISVSRDIEMTSHSSADGTWIGIDDHDENPLYKK